MEKIFEVQISSEKVDKLKTLLTKLNSISINDLSFREKKENINSLFGITNEIINDRGECFERAAEVKWNNPYIEVKVKLNQLVENLIDESINKQKEIIDSYHFGSKDNDGLQIIK